jgi:exonuclease III
MKMLSWLMRRGGNRYVKPSVSCGVVANEMVATSDLCIKEACKDFAPTKDRVTDMIKGELVTIKMPAYLYPRREIFVRVGQRVRRIDEGNNEVVALNREEVNVKHEGWLTTMDSVANSEAHLTVRAFHAISLGVGDISIAAQPASCLRRTLMATAARQLEEENDNDMEPVIKSLAVASEPEESTGDREESRGPTFMTRMCNGIVRRMKKRCLEGQFCGHIHEIPPGIISSQEVRLLGEKEYQGQVDSDDAGYWDRIMAPLREEYDALSLCSACYAGRAVRVNKMLYTSTATYNLDGEEGYENSGRFVKPAFPHITVRPVYVPFNGQFGEYQLQRHQKWDAASKREVSAPPEMGDMNADCWDADSSPHSELWKRHVHVGIGVADSDQGVGGTTSARPRDMLEAGYWADAFTTPHQDMEEEWASRGQGMLFGKGLKLDLLADDSITLSGGLLPSRILGSSRDHEDFMGSDHAPLVCTLHLCWQSKANLQRHYEAATKDAATDRSSGRSKDDGWRIKAMHVKAVVKRWNPETQVVPKMPRPEEFPKQLWKLVAPLEQTRVPGQFKRFKSREYLVECIAEMKTDLDISPCDEWYAPAWKPGGEEGKWLQENVLRALTIANLDVPAFPNPDEVEMAQDVIAELETMDGRPHNSRGRKLPAVQKMFLLAKTNIVLKARQLEKAKSEWCHGPVLVAYEDSIYAFMKKLIEDAMERLFMAEQEAEYRILVKEARHMLNTLAKQELVEMAQTNDHIVAGGVDNLESEAGQTRFFEILHKFCSKCPGAKLDETWEMMAAAAGLPLQKPLNNEFAEVQVDGPAEATSLALDSELNETGDRAEEDRAQLPTLLANQVTSVDQDDLHEPYYEENEQLDRGAMLSCLLAKMDDWVTRQSRLVAHNAENVAVDRGTVNTRPDLKISALLEKRAEKMGRTAKLCRDSMLTNMALATVRNSKKVAEKIAKAEMTAEEDSGGEEASDSSTVKPPKKKAAKAPVKKRSGRSSRHKGVSMGKTIPRNLRKQVRDIEYLMKVKAQPNWERDEVEPPHHVNLNLEATRCGGYGRVEVLKMVHGDSGCGLLAMKGMNDSSLCSGESLEMPLSRIKKGISDRDYVASTIQCYKTQEMIYVDSGVEDSCYGRFAQDPIGDHLVKAKLLWVSGKMRLIALSDIDPGDEIYLEYGLSYGQHKLDCKHSRLRAWIEKKCKRRAVEFQYEVTVAEFQDSVTMKHNDGLRIREEGELLRAPGNSLTRADCYITEEVGDSGYGEIQGFELSPEVLDSFSFDDVEESVELADELRSLKGREFEDEGRLCEIWLVRHDPLNDRVIGFRRSLSERTNSEDGSPFSVLGIEGRYKLSAGYWLTQPEDRSGVPWPTTGSEWTRLPREDTTPSETWNEIEAAGGFSLRISRTKYCLDPTEDAESVRILVREVADTQKGVLRQTRVPRRRVPFTMRVHHERFAHMVANRMFETIRLRYCWSNMDEDIQRHTSTCLNCVLRSYLRRPSVPIMYGDMWRPRDWVYVDLTGPLPRTRTQFKYMMVIRDYLTEYVWLVLLKTKSAVDVAETLVGEFGCVAGKPGRVVSEVGNEFVNMLPTDVSCILNFNCVSTAPHSPRSDGFVENHNKKLKDQLFHYGDNLKRDDWDLLLPTVQLMHNTDVSLATGHAPIRLMTGREASVHVQSYD